MEYPDLAQVWPEWKPEKLLGRGTFGTVWQAVRQSGELTSRAAIKRISIPQDPGELESLRSDGLDVPASRTYLKRIVEDFVNEIRLMESFKGIQNIVSIEDYKVIEHTDVLGWDIYIRMELLTPFSTYLCDRKMTQEDVIRLGCDICTALEFCARKNIIHRDIKPENIFVNSFGSFKLGDFGTARNMESLSAGLSQKGTFHYMAPEVVNGIDYDARVDIYSLGLVLYRLLNNNRLPFISEKQLLSPAERRTAFERRIRGEQLPPPSGASEALSRVILKACAFHPSQRFESAAQMRRALQELSAESCHTPVPLPEDTEPDLPEPIPAEPTLRRGQDPRASAGEIAIDAPDLVIVEPRKNSKFPMVRLLRLLKNPWGATILASVLILTLFIGSGTCIYLYRTHPVALEVTVGPDKCQYAQGETLETDGMVLTATCRDGTIKLIQEGYTWQQPRLDAQGEYAVAVRYRGAETTLYVTVGEVSPLSVVTAPDKTLYALNETLDTTGLTLGMLQNGRKTLITEGFTCWPTVITQTGTTEITVIYGNHTTSFQVEVPAVTEIEIASMPDQISYKTGSYLNTEGMTLQVTYSDGSSRIISEGYVYSPRRIEEEGVNYITVSFDNATTSLAVMGYSATSVRIHTLPDKDAYVTDELLDTTGLVLEVSYSDGSSELLTSGFTCRPSVLTKEGIQEITVSYRGISDTYTVTVGKNDSDKIENFSFRDLKTYLSPLTYSPTGLGYNESGQEIYWVLGVEFDLSSQLAKQYSRTVTCSWTEDLYPYIQAETSFSGTRRGTTYLSNSYLSAEETGMGTGRCCLYIFLPDDSALSGTQSVTVTMGPLTKTVTFDLVYLGDYVTGTGWGLKNIRYS